MPLICAAAVPLIYPRRCRSSTLRGDVEFGAEFSPHFPWFAAFLDGFGGGFATEAEEDVVDEQCVAAHLSELVADQLVKFGQSHVSDRKSVV